MRNITIALCLIAVVAFAASPPLGSNLTKFTVGTKHGASACTVNMGGILWGADFARFSLRGDTIVDTVSYYQTDVQFKPFPGTFWSASVALVSDSVTMNSEGTTKFVSDTLTGTANWYGLFGTMAYSSRFILTPTALAAKQGIKNCTLFVTTYKK